MAKIIFWNIKTEPGEGKFQYEEGIGAHKLSTIAGSLGWETAIYQDHQFRADPRSIREETENALGPGDNIIAYSLMSKGLPLLEELVENQTALGIPVLLGGPGATIEPERVLKLYEGRGTPVALVQGDGEPLFEKLLESAPEKWHEVEGAWALTSAGIVPGKFQIAGSLDTSPYADLGASTQRKKTAEQVEDSSLAPETRLELLKSLMISQIESGRGCYYNCEFCGTSSLEYSKVRKSSPKRLVDEMEHMFEEHGITFFSITDNVAFDKADWWMEFASLMEGSRMTPYIQFGGYSAPRFLSKPIWMEKVIPALYDVGLRGVILGVQAGSRRVLRDIVHRSPYDPENALKATKRLVPLGLNMKVDFIIGHPTETLKELEVTHQWIKNIYQAGGEVFVRKLGVVPHSGYAAKLDAGEYTLPEETPEYKATLDRILSMKARDDQYKRIAFAGRVPNKYLIDRDKWIIYPSTLFPSYVLQQGLEDLSRSRIPEHIKNRYTQMFELALEVKSKGYEF